MFIRSLTRDIKMKFFEKFEKATPRIINQLWQSDYLDTPARNEAMELICRR
jgi:hypothetical protein